MENESKIPAIILCTILNVLIGSSILNCGKAPSEPDLNKYGAIELRVQFNEALQKKSALAATSFDSLVMEISASDMDTLRWSRKVQQQLVLKDTCKGIPAGSKRSIKIFTIDKNGSKIHIDSIKNRTVKIDQNTLTVINAKMIPAAGSIYLQLGNVPSNVKYVYVSFVSSGGKIWEKQVSRSVKMFVSLDNIQDNTKGILSLLAVSTAGDTVYSAKSELTFDARESSKIALNFDEKPGRIAMNLDLEKNGTSYISIDMSRPGVQNERGDFFITEILYNSPDSEEYIELYNPSSSELYYDLLIIYIDNSKKIITDILIPPKDYYVLSRKEFSWTDKVVSFLDLSNSSNLISFNDKDSTIIDQVILSGESNSTEWPVSGSNKAIALDTLFYSADKNNFGRNWAVVGKNIPGNDKLYGNPGEK